MDYHSAKSLKLGGLSKPAETQNLYSTGLAAAHYNSAAAALIQQFSFTKENQYFRNQKICVDGYTFKNCRFDDCEIVIYKGTFIFDHCVIGDSTVIVYGSEALKVVKLFNSKSPQWNLYPNLVANLNADGTFSLS